MKQTLKRRICAAILCHILLLGLAGCGKANKAKPNDGGDPPVKASVDALKQGQPAADSASASERAMPVIFIKVFFIFLQTPFFFIVKDKN